MKLWEAPLQVILYIVGGGDVKIDIETYSSVLQRAIVRTSTLKLVVARSFFLGNALSIIRSASSLVPCYPYSYHLTPLLTYF